MDHHQFMNLMLGDRQPGNDPEPEPNRNPFRSDPSPNRSDVGRYGQSNELSSNAANTRRRNNFYEHQANADPSRRVEQRSFPFPAENYGPWGGLNQRSFPPSADSHGPWEEGAHRSFSSPADAYRSSQYEDQWRQRPPPDIRYETAPDTPPTSFHGTPTYSPSPAQNVSHPYNMPPTHRSVPSLDTNPPYPRESMYGGPALYSAPPMQDQRSYHHKASSTSQVPYFNTTGSFNRPDNRMMGTMHGYGQHPVDVVGPLMAPGYGMYPGHKNNNVAQMQQQPFDSHTHAHAEPSFLAPEKDPGLSSLLLGLPELNILILGESGVGKSTFVNAFVNYLTYDSLDTALQLREVACVIPSTFTWQSLEGNKYVPKTVSIQPNTGNHVNDAALADENVSADGEAATQRPKTHEVEVGQTKVRLIDTPGIGDPRGNAKDKENMDSIIAKLRSFHEIHGILILLKPNTSRLSVWFLFCLKELLMHLHKDAAKNIVFGFTSARETSFRPGDTYNILSKELAKDPGMGIELDFDTSYFFDSESFRCLAANKRGLDVHDMGDVGEYTSSWNKSAKETYRLLDYLRNIVAHKAKRTTELAHTRELVRILTRPMADITRTINSNIKLLQDEKNKVQDALDTGKKLKISLKKQKIVRELQPLDKPRTVCTEADCTAIVDNQKIYKNPCHPECNIPGIEGDKVGFEGLMRCVAFGCGASVTCLQCGHHWNVHMHYFFDSIEKTEEVDDEAVAKRLKDNASTVDVALTVIKDREKTIEEMKGERGKIQKAAAQFTVYLKGSSIKQYNDSKLDYLDLLIEDEKAKVHAGGLRKALDDLQAERAQHVEEVRTITEYTQQGKNHKALDETGIKKLIQELYNLKHIGANLKLNAEQMKDIETNANEKADMVARRQSTSRGHRHTSNNSNRPTSTGGLMGMLKNARNVLT